MWFHVKALYMLSEEIRGYENLPNSSKSLHLYSSTDCKQDCRAVNQDVSICFVKNT